MQTWLNQNKMIAQSNDNTGAAAKDQSKISSDDQASTRKFEKANPAFETNLMLLITTTNPKVNNCNHIILSFLFFFLN